MSVELKSYLKILIPTEERLVTKRIGNLTVCNKRVRTKKKRYQLWWYRILVPRSSQSADAVVPQCRSPNVFKDDRETPKHRRPLSVYSIVWNCGKCNMNDMGDKISDSTPIEPWARRLLFAGLLTIDFIGFACYAVVGPIFPPEVLRNKNYPPFTAWSS